MFRLARSDRLTLSILAPERQGRAGSAPLSIPNSSCAYAANGHARVGLASALAARREQQGWHKHDERGNVRWKPSCDRPTPRGQTYSVSGTRTTPPVSLNNRNATRVRLTAATAEHHFSRHLAGHERCAPAVDQVVDALVTFCRAYTTLYAA